MFITQLIQGVIAQKQAEQAPKPARTITATPLRLAQGSRLNIQPMGLLLANGQGSIFRNVTLDNHQVVAVGTFGLFNTVRYYHVYLSGLEGGYLALAVNNANKLIESRLYRLYTEVNPTSIEEWKFWLVEGQRNVSDDDGYIGKLYANSLDEDGPVEYTRDWGGNAPRMDPLTPIEVLVDINGGQTRLHHRLMQYSRPLSGDNKIAEHLRVSAMAENSTDPSGVTFWVGIDVDPGEIQVFPATDAPAFP